ISAEGVIEIHQLNAPNKLFRARKWAKPDQFLLSKKEHDAMFKTDVYNDENDIYKWEKGVKVFESKFNTAVTKELLLKGKEKWVAGNYVMEAIAKDKDGEEVK